ncbi:MAG: alkaline phosphatase, partial [Sphingobacteriales bacterium]
MAPASTMKTVTSITAYNLLGSNFTYQTPFGYTGTITDVWALGTKDVSEPGNGFDISDNNNEILIANWPIKAYYMPDGAATYSVGGVNYLVTANEGDEKEYTGFVERTTIGAATYNLDATAFPQASM